MEHINLSDIGLGVIGGSGLYEMEAVTRIEPVTVSTPFGDPSDAYMVGELNGIKVAFLPRHGKGHEFLPSEINYRANIFGFKKLGVSHLIAVTAVGSLKQAIAPLDIVIPDQLVDRTCRRPDTFFGNGIAAHIPFADPFCPVLSDLMFTSAAALNGGAHRGGTLVNIEGPAFSTRAESRLYREWGIDIIGMTTLQEAKLAREAEICFAAMAMVTDYDCWKKESKDVCVNTVTATFSENLAAANAIINDLAPKIAPKRQCPCHRSLEGAIMTQMDRISPDTRRCLGPIINKYLTS